MFRRTSLTYIKAQVGIPASMSNVPKREGEGECKSIQVEREGARQYRLRERGALPSFLSGSNQWRNSCLLTHARTGICTQKTFFSLHTPCVHNGCPRPLLFLLDACSGVQYTAHTHTHTRNINTSTKSLLTFNTTKMHG